MSSLVGRRLRLFGCRCWCLRVSAALFILQSSTLLQVRHVFVSGAQQHPRQTTPVQSSTSSVVIDLSKGIVKGYDSRIQFLVPPTAGTSNKDRSTRTSKVPGKCASQALLKVSLGRKERLVRIQLLSLKRSKQWSFHLSDSPHARGSLRYVEGADDIEPYSEVWLYNGLLNVLGDNEYRSPRKTVPPSIARKIEAGKNPVQIFGEPVAKASSRRIRRARRRSRAKLEPKGSDAGSEKARAGSRVLQTTRGDAAERKLYGGRSALVAAAATTATAAAAAAARPKLKILAGKNFLSWKGDDYQDYLPHDSLFTFRGPDRVLYIGLNRVVESDEHGAPRRNGSGLCKVTISLSRPRDDCTGQKNDCGPNSICKKASRNKHVCICKPGWQRSGKTCVDYDECQIQNGGCVHHCLNFEGNFTCGCREGFRVDPASSTNCIDVDECAGSDHGCEHGCRNTVGSYECFCDAGFMLSPDGRDCIEMDEECEELNCSHMCVTGKSHNSNNVTAGNASSPSTHLSSASRTAMLVLVDSASTSLSATSSPTTPASVLAAKKRCRCFGGFFPNPPDYRACRRTCAVGNGGCQHYCRDSRRGPVCSCRSNYILAADNATCLAACGMNNGGCSGICLQSDYGPACSCQDGYRLGSDGQTCEDINECATEAANCTHECRNVDGGYECVCPAGLKLQMDQRTCVDVDECQINGTCQFRCANSYGSYSCACPDGYQLFGSIHCGDFDECAVNNGGCAQICKNRPGSHECRCRPGFRLHPNGRDCVDATVCLPLPTPSKARMTCTTSYDGFYEETCEIRCDAAVGGPGSAFLLRSASNARRATLTCGARTRYEWMDADGNDGLPLAAFGCSEQTTPLMFRMEGSLVYHISEGLHCPSVEPLLSSVTKETEDKMREMLKSTCEGVICDVHIVEANCSAPLSSESTQEISQPEGTDEDAGLRFVAKFTLIVDDPLELMTSNLTPNAEGSDGERDPGVRRRKRKSRQQRSKNRREIPFDGCALSTLRNRAEPPVDVDVVVVPDKVDKEELLDCRAIRKRVARKVQRTVKQLRVTAKEFWNDEKLVRLDSLNGLSAKVKMKKWTPSLEQSCPPGHESNGIVCLGCGLGSYLDAKSGLCKICPPGTYQDQEGHNSCRACPEIILNSAPENGHTPREAPWLFKGLVGATSLTECAGACPPGTFSRNGRQPCKPCPKGSFQSGHGRTECDLCGANATTVRPGATSFQVCLTREICRAGGFWNKTLGMCQVCPKGFYQPQDQRDFCFACPANSTTEGPGSTQLADCSQTSCGQFSDGLMGYLETPNYPGHYPPRSSCTWTIKPPRGKRLLFFIPKLQISASDSCEDFLLLRKNSNPQSRTSFISCDRLLNPVAITARSRNIWAHFEAKGNFTSAGFRIMYVVYNTEYQPLIEEIVKDPALLSTQSHVRVFQDPELLRALLEVIAQPVNYYKYVNIQSQLFPSSFIDLLTPKVRKFLSYR